MAAESIKTGTITDHDVPLHLPIDVDSSILLLTQIPPMTAWDDFVLFHDA